MASSAACRGGIPGVPIYLAHVHVRHILVAFWLNAISSFVATDVQLMVNIVEIVKGRLFQIKVHRHS